MSLKNKFLLYTNPQLILNGIEDGFFMITIYIIDDSLIRSIRQSLV